MSNTKEKLQSVGIPPVRFHASMKTLKSNISEAYKVQGYCLKDSGSDSHDKNDMKEWNDMIIPSICTIWDKGSNMEILM